MNKKQTIFHPFKEHTELEIQNLIHSYGIDIPIEQIKEIEILEITGKTITYWNRRKNEIITSNLTGKVYEKYDAKYSVSLTTSNMSKTFFVEHFNSVEPSTSFKQAGENALKSRNNSETKLLSRAYADVNTKYGDFCLHLEENYTNYVLAPYRQLSLYYGNHKQTFDEQKNEFDFTRYSLFSWKSMDFDNFNQCSMGYNNNAYNNPVINIWSYGISEHNSRKVKKSIYSFNSHKSNDAGVILIDGSVKVAENLKRIPKIFHHYEIENQIEEYENNEYESKAFFVNHSECLAIVKKDKIISFEYKKKNPKTGEWHKNYSKIVSSANDKEFNLEDFKFILSSVIRSEIDDELKRFAISQLSGYANIKYEKNLSKLNKYIIESYTFESMLDFIRESDLTKLVEDGIELLSEIFNIKIEEILGKNAPNQLKNTRCILKKR